MAISRSKLHYTRRHISLNTYLLRFPMIFILEDMCKVDNRTSNSSCSVEVYVRPGV